MAASSLQSPSPRELKSKESIKQAPKYKAEAAKKKEATKGKTASIVSGLFSMGGIAFKK